MLLKFYLFLLFYVLEDFIYLFMKGTQKEAETQAEGEAGSQSRDHALSLKAAAQPLSHPGAPKLDSSYMHLKEF